VKEREGFIIKSDELIKQQRYFFFLIKNVLQTYKKGASHLKSVGFSNNHIFKV
jgi:hypothetical protein